MGSLDGLTTAQQATISTITDSLLSSYLHLRSPAPWLGLCSCPCLSILHMHILHTVHILSIDNPSDGAGSICCSALPRVGNGRGKAPRRAASATRETHLAAGQDGVAVSGVQVGRKGRAHEARRIGIRFHAIAGLCRHREGERSCSSTEHPSGVAEQWHYALSLAAGATACICASRAAPVCCSILGESLKRTIRPPGCSSGHAILVRASWSTDLHPLGRASGGLRRPCQSSPAQPAPL